MTSGHETRINHIPRILRWMWFTSLNTGQISLVIMISTNTFHLLDGHWFFSSLLFGIGFSFRKQKPDLLLLLILGQTKLSKLSRCMITRVYRGTFRGQGTVTSVSISCYSAVDLSRLVPGVGTVTVWHTCDDGDTGAWHLAPISGGPRGREGPRSPDWLIIAKIWLHNW